MAFYPHSNLTYVAAQSISASYNAPAGVKEGLNNLFVAAQITGGTSPTGTLKIQLSPDGVSWADYPGGGGGAPQAITANGNYCFTISGLSSRFFRLAWVFTSGTGSPVMSAQYELSAGG